MFQSLDDLLKILNPTIVASLKRAIELGKWPNGVVITDTQKSLCAEAVAYWEQSHSAPESRVGYIPPKATPCGDKSSDDKSDEDTALTWVES
ncbi:DUF1315 family protein [Microbulbifer bruguierae]|uniref:DUF1315 family protein n=1 Tax=Microbulbifer bruguierae TaxID=3029061 RepID=A0ABY8NH46_9GAMM|nr:DUF1315 family protein [Microbulbifer bruguierae]WGL18246.1 DUF1315 family protein [Microbulbifer bruguierae]